MYLGVAQMTNPRKKFKAVSLFSGAGGFDVGFQRAGFEIVWANDSDPDACQTYRGSVGCHIHAGDISQIPPARFKAMRNVDVVFGGPPCQGFSVAGKMNPLDPRSNLVRTFADVVAMILPKVFVMENVKALGCLEKWEPVRKWLMKRFSDSGYLVDLLVLNASDFNVPQSRERVFFIGVKSPSRLQFKIHDLLEVLKTPSPSVRETLLLLPPAGTGNNKPLTKAKITFASNPVMRASPYAGMLFNGAGRPLRLDGYSSTLPATMGGNKTPIVDENALRNGGKNWVEKYHKELLSGAVPNPLSAPPSRLRRLTAREASILQTFPLEHKFHGSPSSVFRQIGNAVPCNLATAIARLIRAILVNKKPSSSSKRRHPARKKQNLTLSEGAIPQKPHSPPPRNQKERF